MATSAMKAKEKELKEEKEEERQVRLPHTALNPVGSTLIFDYRNEYKPSRTNEQRRRSVKDTRNWLRRCTRSAWSD